MIGATWFAPVYAAVLGLTALAFVGRFKVKKLMSKGMLGLLAIGIVIFAVIIILRAC